MDDQQNNSPMSPDTQVTPQAPLDAKGMARRRFTRAGVGVSGVILTLHSQAGMPTFSKELCKSPSGYMSMKPGASARPQVSCSYNRSHGYWKTHAEEWKTAAGIDSNTKFGKVFVCGGKYADLADATMMQVIDPTDKIKKIDHNNVAMQTVAAYLNGRAASFAGLPTVLPAENVVEIWNQFILQGAYTPFKGATPWDGATIAAYFESTFR